MRRKGESLVRFLERLSLAGGMPVLAGISPPLPRFCTPNRCRHEDGQWAVKRFIDIFGNPQTISSATKIVSNILKIRLFTRILAFAEADGHKIVPENH